MLVIEWPIVLHYEKDKTRSALSPDAGLSPHVKNKMQKTRGAISASIINKIKNILTLKR